VIPRSLAPSLPRLLALLLSVLAVFVAWQVTERVFEGIPHIEDEIAYVWQGQVMARGSLTLPTPPHPDSFLVPFVVDYDGQRFGKYPPGWAVLLAIGIRLGVRGWLNPLLAGLAVWLTYRLGEKLFAESVGLLAAALTTTSPFFLMNSGTLLSHPFGLVLNIAFALAWLDLFPSTSPVGPFPANEGKKTPASLLILIAGLCLGALALTRPLTALAVGLPFGLHGVYLLARGNDPTRRRVLTISAISLAVGSVIFLWQYALSGNALLNPYTLWWSYDKVGFGPGYGVSEEGHHLRLAWVNTKFSLWVGWRDLFGWGGYSWIFLPFGLIAVVLRRRGRALLVGSVVVSLVVVYLAYWVSSWLFGPRYFYEGLHSLTLFSAAGIAWLAGWLRGENQQSEAGRKHSGRMHLRPLAVMTLLAIFIVLDLRFYLPLRLGGMHGLYGIERADFEPFLAAQAQNLSPALIIVHTERWEDYGGLLELETPFLDTPFIFAWSRGAKADAALAADFPDRHIYHYDPQTPFVFYSPP
jgi:hypothetical protein